MTVQPSQASHPSSTQESPHSYSVYSLLPSYKDQQTSILLTIASSID
jgi:hypothetical protein